MGDYFVSFASKDDWIGRFASMSDRFGLFAPLMCFVLPQWAIVLVRLQSNWRQRRWPMLTKSSIDSWQPELKENWSQNSTQFRMKDYIVKNRIRNIICTNCFSLKRNTSLNLLFWRFFAAGTVGVIYGSAASNRVVTYDMGKIRDDSNKHKARSLVAFSEKFLLLWAEWSLFSSSRRIFQVRNPSNRRRMKVRITHKRARQAWEPVIPNGAFVVSAFRCRQPTNAIDAKSSRSWIKSLTTQVSVRYF